MYKRIQLVIYLHFLFAMQMTNDKRQMKTSMTIENQSYSRFLISYLPNSATVSGPEWKIKSKFNILLKLYGLAQYCGEGNFAL